VGTFQKTTLLIFWSTVCPYEATQDIADKLHAMLQLPPIFLSQHIHPKKSMQQAKKSKSSEVSLVTTF
jgi:hypothetical protein